MYRYIQVRTTRAVKFRLVLALYCVVLSDWYVLVRTSMYHFAQSCPGVQDSRCLPLMLATIFKLTHYIVLVARGHSGWLP